jgi:tetratricopeptide (TPR) repeat protein
MRNRYSFWFLGLLVSWLLIFTACTRKDVKWLREGTKQGKAGEYENALHSFDMAIQENPNSAQAFQGKGYTLELLGRNDEAMQAYDHAIDLNAEYPQSWLSKGMLYLKLDKPEDALMAFTRALQLRPDWDQAHYEEGLALQQVGRLDDAIAQFTAAMKYSPPLAVVYYGRAKAYLDKGDSAAFFADLKKAVSLDTAYARKAASDSSLTEMRANPEFQHVIGK